VRLFGRGRAEVAASVVLANLFNEHGIELDA